MAAPVQLVYRDVPPPPLPEWYMPGYKEDAESASSSSPSSASNDEALQLTKAPDCDPPPCIPGYDGTKGQVQLPPTLATSPLLGLPLPLVSTVKNPKHCEFNAVPPPAIFHICRICMRPRSNRYHIKHPIPIDGVPPPPGICRRCRFVAVEELSVVEEEMAPRVVRRRRSSTRMGIKSLVPQYDVFPTETHQKRLDKELANDRDFDRVYYTRTSRSVSPKPITYRYVRRTEEKPRYRVRRYYCHPSKDDEMDESCSQDSDDADDSSSMADFNQKRPSRTIERKTRISARSSSSQAYPGVDQKSSKTNRHEIKITRSTSSSPACSRSASPARESVTKVEINREIDYPKSKCLPRTCEESAPCRQQTDSHIRRIARDEVESYRRAERMMAAHPDAYAHGRMTPVSGQKEPVRDIRKVSRENRSSAHESRRDDYDRETLNVGVKRTSDKSSTQQAVPLSRHSKIPSTTKERTSSKEPPIKYRTVRVTEVLNDDDPELQSPDHPSAQRSWQPEPKLRTFGASSHGGQESSRASSGRWDTSGSGGTPAYSTATSKTKQMSGSVGASAESATISVRRGHLERDTLQESTHSTSRHQPHRVINIPPGFRIVYPGDSPTVSPPDSIIGGSKRTGKSKTTSSGHRSETREAATSLSKSARQSEQSRSKHSSGERASSTPTQPSKNSRESTARASQTTVRAAREQESSSSQRQASSRDTVLNSQSRRRGSDAVRDDRDGLERLKGDSGYLLNGRAPKRVEEEIEEILEWVPSRTNAANNRQDRARQQSPHERTSNPSSRATDRDYMISQRYVDRIDPSGTSRTSKYRYETHPAPNQLFVTRDSAHSGSSRSRPDSGRVQFARLVHVSPTPPGSNASSSAFRSYHSYGKGTTKPVEGNENSARAEESSQRGRSRTRESVDGRTFRSSAESHALQEMRRRASRDPPFSESPSRERTVSRSGGGDSSRTRSRYSDAHGPYRQKESSRSVEASAGSWRSQRNHRSESDRRGSGSGLSSRQWW